MRQGNRSGNPCRNRRPAGRSSWRPGHPVFAIRHPSSWLPTARSTSARARRRRRGSAGARSGSVLAIKDGKSCVFADGLGTVSGLEWIDGALDVVHPPELSSFRDTDRDGRADERIDLVTGLGPTALATHGINDHIAAGIRAGIDGYLYLAVGDKGVSRAVGKDGRSIKLAGGGVIRVRPDGTALEVVSTGERNPRSIALSATRRDLHPGRR